MSPGKGKPVSSVLPKAGAGGNGANQHSDLINVHLWAENGSYNERAPVGTT